MRSNPNATLTYLYAATDLKYMLEKFRLLTFRIFRAGKFAAYKGNILRPLKIQGAEYIFVEKGVFIHDFTWLGAYPIDGNVPELRFGEGTCIGHFNHFSCSNKIIIGKNVLTADKVFIADNTHNFEDTNVPVMHQSIRVLQPVSIGDGAWIGENVSIIGASVGKNSIIGANSVVTKDIPDYCVAVGNPARVIKRFNKEKQSWETVTQ